MAWDGTLSVEDFERAALYLVTTWERCCPELPQWTWQKTAPSAIPGHVSRHYFILWNCQFFGDNFENNICMGNFQNVGEFILYVK